MASLSKKQTSDLVNQDQPHYYMIYIENQEHGANKRCCGTKRDLEDTLRLYPGSRWEKIYLPRTPDTVDVPHVTVGKDQELPMQQILPESTLEEIKLTND